MTGRPRPRVEFWITRSGAVAMHLNKLSTAALMRMTILASLNLLLGRFVGYGWLLHPVLFLSS